MEALLIIAVLGFGLFVPIGSILGFLAFRRRSEQAGRIEVLEREVSTLRDDLARLQQRPDGREQMRTPAVEPVAPDEPDIQLTLDEPGPVPVAAGDTEAQSRAALQHRDAGVGPGQNAGNTSGEGAGVDWTSRVIEALKQNWMVWLGGLSVGLAGIFMVSHSINAGLIGPLQQLMLALITGVALHAGAEYLRRRHKGVDQVFAALAGGGSITLYAALLAGVHHYELISPLAGLVGLAAVSLATMVLALVHGPLLAIMGLSGAYLVPLLIGGEDGSVAFVLSYSFLITLSSLLLMRYVFRNWLWYATLAGAVLWWLVMASSAPVESSTAWYVAGLFLAFSALPGAGQLAPYRLREAFLPLLVLWLLSVADQPDASPLFWSWLLILPVAALVPQSRGPLWYLPWGAVFASAVGWLLHMLRPGPEGLSVVTLAIEHRSGFLSYLIAATVVTLTLGLWQWARNTERRRWASLTLLSPLVWLVMGWLLIHGFTTSTPWAVGTLLLGALYGVLAWQMESRERYRSGVVWALMAAHISYTLAVVMAFREASLTLALAVQFVSLTWLAGRYRMPELYLLLKLALALVVARLTFNPWVQGYDASVHWSLWTYGGATVFAAIACRIADRSDNIRLWLEAATLHLLVLFLGTEMRYWLYDGNIFVREYTFTEATINTLLWGGLSLAYLYRARASQSLAWLYRLFSRVLLGLSGLSYITLLTLHNPWWSNTAIAETPVLNMLLLAYGGPVLLALAVSLLPQLAPRRWSLWVAAGSFLLFTALEIRQLWQGSEMALSFGVTEGELYTYSVVGMLYAVVAIIWSTKRQNGVLYKAGMVLLGIVIAKIFLIDMAGLQGLWRVAAFMGLGLALLGLAWMYRKAQGGPEPDAD